MVFSQVQNLLNMCHDLPAEKSAIHNTPHSEKDQAQDWPQPQIQLPNAGLQNASENQHPDIPVGNVGLEYACTALCSQTCAPSSCSTSQLDLSQLCSEGIGLQLIQGAEGRAK